jgi:hypothetical protein
VAAWNGPRNAAVRNAVRPARGPIGPFPVIGAGAGVTASPRGDHKVHVVVSQARAPIGGTPVTPCFVVFWYGSGRCRRPGTVVVSAKPGMREFDLTAAHMYFGVNTDHRGAPRATHHSDGRLPLVAASR